MERGLARTPTRKRTETTEEDISTTPSSSKKRRTTRRKFPLLEEDWGSEKTTDPIVERAEETTSPPPPGSPSLSPPPSTPPQQTHQQREDDNKAIMEDDFEKKEDDLNQKTTSEDDQVFNDTPPLPTMTPDKGRLTTLLSGRQHCTLPDRKSVPDDSTQKSRACHGNVLGGEDAPRASCQDDLSTVSQTKKDKNFVRNTATTITVNGVSLLDIQKNKKLTKMNIQTDKKIGT